MSCASTSSGAGAPGLWSRPGAAVPAAAAGGGCQAACAAAAAVAAALALPSCKKRSIAAPEAAPCSTNSVAERASRNTGSVPPCGSFLNSAKAAAAMAAALGPSRVVGGMGPRMLRSGFAPAPGPPLYCRTAPARQQPGKVQCSSSHVSNRRAALICMSSSVNTGVPTVLVMA